MNLKDELRKIVEVQKIDSQIYGFEQKKDGQNPALLKELKENWEKKKTELTRLEETAKQTQVKKKEKELDLSSKEETLKKAHAHLYQLKTNKEYQAKLTEIASLKADISVLEETVIGVLDEIEGTEKKLHTDRENFAREEKEIKNQENKILNEIKELEVQIKHLNDKKSIIIGGIDKNLYSKYAHLLTTRDSLAIAPVINNSCGACFIQTSHQKINEIKMYKELIFCDNCVRILYIAEDIGE